MPTLLEALGNVADLPGSFVRDAVALENPLDQFLSPFSQDNRTSGRQLLGKFGMGDDHDIGGFIADVALDPLTWAGFGFPMLKKGIQGLTAGTRAGNVPGLIKSLVKGDAAAAKAAWKSATTKPAAAAAATKPRWIVDLDSRLGRASTAAEQTSEWARRSAPKSRNPLTGAADLEQVAVSVPRAPLVERLIDALTNQNVRKMAKGGGLLQLQSLGRESGADPMMFDMPIQDGSSYGY